MTITTEFVWRLENEKGEGVYSMRVGDRSSSPMKMFETDYFYTPAHPNPYDDGIDNRRERHIFGFRDLAQARAWFHNAADNVKLSEYGVQLTARRRYDLREITEGRRQLIFLQDRDVFTARLDLELLHEMGDEELHELAHHEIEAQVAAYFRERQAA